MKARKIKQKKQKPIYSPEHKAYLKKQKIKQITILSFQIGILLCFVAFWEIFTHFRILDPFMVSSPSRIIKTIGTMLDEKTLFVHIGTTMAECLLGFLISTLLGTGIAIALWSSEYLRKILEPYIVVLNSLPKIALSPLIIIWVGVGMPAILVMTIMICVIITIISMLNSFMACDPDKILLLKSMGANKTKILTKLIIPYSIPDFISVLKINVGLAWVGTIMGEYLTSEKGLGNQIEYGRTIFQHDLVMACTVLLCVLAALMYLAVALVEKLVAKRR